MEARTAWRAEPVDAPLPGHGWRGPRVHAAPFSVGAVPVLGTNSLMRGHGLGDPFDRGKCPRDAVESLPGALGDLRVCLIAVLLPEHGYPFRQEFPRLAEDGSGVCGREREAPADV